jgi:hypothetical protein
VHGKCRGGGTSAVIAEISQPNLATYNPCSARNAISLLNTTLTRSTGQPQEESFSFSLPVDARICLRVTSPLVGGHQVTSATVQIDGHSQLVPSDFPGNGNFSGKFLQVELAAGVHTLSSTLRSKPGTQLVLAIEVPGPTVDSFSPVYADTGSTITFTGEGFIGPVTVKAGNVSLGNPSVFTPNSLTAISVEDMPIGTLTITTPFGSVTTVAPFVSKSPRGLVPFYPIHEFPFESASCVGQEKLTVQQDGTNMAFVVENAGPFPTGSRIVLDIDDDNNQLTVEKTLYSNLGLSVVEGSRAMLVDSFASLDLHSYVKLGRLNLRVRTESGCGTHVSEWIELKSVFAPGLLSGPH